MAAALVAAALSAAGCAERGIPPGGPVDDTAPTILVTEPQDGARGIPQGTSFRVSFSESMNRKSVERALRLAPSPERSYLSWEENTLVVAFAPEESAGRFDERVLTLLRTAEDRRGNNLAAAPEIAYTGGDSLPVGEIAGKLSGETGEPRARLLLFGAPAPTLDSLASAVPLRETSAAADGAFRFRYLDASGADTFALFALSQSEMRSEIDLTRDRVAFGPDTLVLTPAAPRLSEIALTLVKPDAPGSFGGRLDSLHAEHEVLLRSLTDSTRTFEGVVDSGGSFLVDSVTPGSYRLRLVDPTGEVESPFPDFPETLVVRPGEKRRMPGTDSLETQPSDSLSIDGAPQGDGPKEP